MKKVNQLLITICVLCFFYSPTQAQDFEGTIYYDILNSNDEGISQMSYMIKGQKTRLEFGGNQNKGSMLYLPEESKIVFLIDAQKGYMSLDAHEAGTKEDDLANVEATKTGETKTIAGRSCEVWKVVSDNNTVEACMTKGIGTFMMPKNPMARDNTPAWAKELMDEGAMPLEVVEIKNGDRSVNMIATKIEEKSLPADLFEIPEGYRDMSAMLKQIQQMQKQQ